MKFDLRAFRSRSSELVGPLLDDLRPDAPRDELIRMVHECCLHFHTIAVATLLLEADVDELFLNLCRAGANWHRLQSHLKSRGEPPPPATMNAPLLGAVAAGDWTLARRIAEASATEWQKESLEYEDDFAWAALLQHLVRVDPGAHPRTDELMARLRASGEKVYGAHLEVVSALVSGGARSFREAFEALTAIHQEQVEADAASFTIPATEFAPYRYLWLEGLALLRLAERAGMELQEQFLYCPPLARLKRSVQDDGDWSVPFGRG